MLIMEFTYNWLYVKLLYHILLSIVHTFYIENDAEIFLVHYTWKVADIGFKMTFMLNKLAMINSWKIKIFFCQKSLWNSGAHFTRMHIILNKIQYFVVLCSVKIIKLIWYYKLNVWVFYPSLTFLANFLP